MLHRMFGQPSRQNVRRPLRRRVRLAESGELDDEVSLGVPFAESPSTPPAPAPQQKAPAKSAKPAKKSAKKGAQTDATNGAKKGAKQPTALSRTTKKKRPTK